MRKSISNTSFNPLIKRQSKNEINTINIPRKSNNNNDNLLNNFNNVNPTDKNNRMNILDKNSSTTNNYNNSNGNINVVLRCRPQNEKEKKISSEICVNFENEKTVSINSTSEKNNYKFTFDRSFDSETKQIDIFEFVARPILNSVLEGFNGTIFAYGQTSSGKTFTMQGVLDNEELEGITPRIIKAIYDHISNASEENQYIIKISLLEIYNEKIKDLIDPSRTNLQVREDKKKGIYIEDLSEHLANNSREVLNIMKRGMENRSVNFTNMNAESSRSHCLVVFNIIHNNLSDLSTKISKLYLVDLAGSEKTSKTGATGQTLEEAKSINKSLTTLGLVINNLTESKKAHIPYRESKLTRVLQESLGGNSRTCLIITCSPSRYNEAETLSTLRFGIRAKKVKNNARVNKDFSITELKVHIENLEKQINKYKNRMEVLENLMEDNGLAIPSINESFCLDGLKNLLAKKTKDFKDFAIENNSLLISEKNLLAAFTLDGQENSKNKENKYIKEFIIENNINSIDRQLSFISKVNDINLLSGDIKIDQIPNRIPENIEGENSNEDNEDQLIDTLQDRDQEEDIANNNFFEFEQKETSSSEEALNNEKNANENINESFKEENVNNITTGNGKYLELIEMFTKIDKEKNFIEEDLNYAIERIQEFKIEEIRKNNLINDILRLKQNSRKKIGDLEEEINGVINKTFIKQNLNESILCCNNFQHNKQINIEILSELKNEKEMNVANNNVSEKIQSCVAAKKSYDLVIEENVVNLKFERELEINKNKEDQNNAPIKDPSFETPEDTSKIIEKSSEITIELINSNNISPTIGNYFQNINNSKELLPNNTIDTGISININCNSRSKSKGFFNKDQSTISNQDLKNKLLNCLDVTAAPNSNTVKNTKNRLYLNDNYEEDEQCESMKNCSGNGVKINISINKIKEFEEEINNEDVEKRSIKNKKFDLRKYQNSLDQDGFSKIKENKYFFVTDENINRVEDENEKKLDNFFNETENLLTEDNLQKNQGFSKSSIFSNSIFSRDLKKNNEIEERNFSGYFNTENNDKLHNHSNKQDKNFNNSILRKSLLKKFPNPNNNQNLYLNEIFHMHNKKQIDPDLIDNAVKEHDIKKMQVNKSKIKLIIDEHVKINKSNEKEISINKFGLRTPNHNDEFQISTNPQTNVNALQDFGNSIDYDDKNKVIEEMFLQFQEYSNKLPPELNNLIEAYKDKLNLKKNENSSEKNTSSEKFKNSQNSNHSKRFNLNFDFDSSNSIALKNEKNKSNLSNNQTVHSDNNFERSKEFKKTEEIINNLEIKAERLFENYFKKDKLNVKDIIKEDNPKKTGHHINIKKYMNLKDFQI